MKVRSFLWVILAVLVSATIVMAEASLPVIFDNDMVLQRDLAVPIWGWANPGEKVTVEFSGQKKTATADNAGTWMVKLAPMKASSDPAIMKISSSLDTRHLTFSKVLVGDIWICSGQSNMEYGFKGNGNEYKNKNVRVFRVPSHLQAPFPMDDTQGSWASFADGNSRGCSGVALFFGCKLQKELGIPIGLIDTCWGGTKIESWIASEGYKIIGQPLPEPDITKVLAQQKVIIEKIDKWVVLAEHRAKADRFMPFNVNTKIYGHARNGIYNAMVVPLAPFGVKGAIWYQGEANRKNSYPDYFTKLQGLIGGWRKVFEVPDFPFYIVQIAPFDYNRGNRQGDDTILCNNIWASEYKAAEEIKNCGMIPTHDTISDNIKDIHPKDKKTVGERLAALALNKTYGKDVICSGPVFNSAKLKGGKVIVSFDKIDQGLETADGKAPTWFELSSDGKEFITAEAAIEGRTVVVTSKKVAEPKFVRMGWSEIAIPTLRDKNGWPAFQFSAMRVE